MWQSPTTRHPEHHRKQNFQPPNLQHRQGKPQATWKGQDTSLKLAREQTLGRACANLSAKNVPYLAIPKCKEKHIGVTRYWLEKTFGPFHHEKDYISSTGSLPLLGVASGEKCHLPHGKLMAPRCISWWWAPSLTKQVGVRHLDAHQNTTTILHASLGDYNQVLHHRFGLAQRTQIVSWNLWLLGPQKKEHVEKPHLQSHDVFNDFLGTARNTKMTIVNKQPFEKDVSPIWKMASFHWHVSFSGGTTLILNKLVGSPQQLGIRKCQNPHRWRPAPGEFTVPTNKWEVKMMSNKNGQTFFCKIIHILKWMYSATSWLKIVMTWWFNNWNWGGRCGQCCLL